MSEPWVQLNIDGQPRPLRFNGEAFAEFEMQYARSIGVPEYPFGKVIKRFYDQETKLEVLTSYNLLAHLLWAGLKWRWLTLTPQLVLQKISAFEEKGGNLLEEVWPVIEQAWLATGMFKHLIRRVEHEAQPGNGQTEPDKLEGETASASKSSGSDAGSTPQQP